MKKTKDPNQSSPAALFLHWALAGLGPSLGGIEAKGVIVGQKRLLDLPAKRLAA